MKDILALFRKKRGLKTIKMIEIDETETLLSITAPNKMSIAIVEPDEMVQCYYNYTFNGYFGCIYNGDFYVSDKYPHKTATANYYKEPKQS